MILKERGCDLVVTMDGSGVIRSVIDAHLVIGRLETAFEFELFTKLFLSRHNWIQQSIDFYEQREA